jgi:hypothetical protein
MADDRHYNTSEKGRARHRRYNASAKGRARSARFDVTAAGIRRKIEYDERDGHECFIQRDRLLEREKYEASGSSLPFHEWLNETYPLPMLRLPA